jgi:hypothetical protein
MAGEPNIPRSSPQGRDISRLCMLGSTDDVSHRSANKLGLIYQTDSIAWAVTTASVHRPQLRLQAAVFPRQSPSIPALIVPTLIYSIDHYCLYCPDLDCYSGPDSLLSLPPSRYYLHLFMETRRISMKPFVDRELDYARIQSYPLQPDLSSVSCWSRYASVTK